MSHNNISSLSAEVIDGVHRYPQSGLKVVIVGAGVGGLLTGLECWRKGHQVTILERADKISPLGDCFTITPSALVTLGKYPKMHVRYNEKMYDSPVSFWSTYGKLYFQEEAAYHVAPEHAAMPDQKQISFQKSRAEFADMLHQQVARLGIPVFWGRKVTQYEEDALSSIARVRTDSGEVFEGDVVVAADGVRTRSHETITGKQMKVRPSGYSVSRVSFPRSAIAVGTPGNSILPKIQERPQFRIYPADNMHLMLMLNQDWCGFAFTHPDREGNSAESWSNHISNEQMIAILKENKGDWDPAVIDFLRQVPDTSKIVDWQLSWRDPQPQWASNGGRIVQVGDAAHSFLPTSGNGATQAMEDAISISECLRLGGKQGAPWATKVHEKLRFERVSLMQKMGFINRERLHHAADRLEHAGAEMDDVVATIHHTEAWMWNHNPEKYATEKYHEALAHLRYGNAFANSNLPDGYKHESWTIEGVVETEEALRKQELIPAPTTA